MKTSIAGKKYRKNYNQPLKIIKYPKMTKNSKGFSLIELIIVITIIAVLITIGTITMKNRFSKSRDANRIGGLVSIESILSTYFYSTGNLPLPDKKINLTSSGTSNIIGYQGYFGTGVLNYIKNINTIPKDPDGNFFTYRINSSKNKFQIMGYFENEDSDNLYNFSDTQETNRKTPKTKGDKIGIIVENIDEKSPIQDNVTIISAGYLDIAKTSNTYNLIFDDELNISGTGLNLISLIVANDTSLSSQDPALISHWAFEDTNNPRIKDFSINNNHGVSNQKINRKEGLIGNGINFEKNQKGFVQIANSSSLQPTNQISISLWIKPQNITGEGENTGLICKGFLPGADYCLSRETRVGQNNKTIYGYINSSKISSILNDLNTWQHIVLTYNKSLANSNIKLYINGVLRQTSNYNQDINSSTNPIHIGKTQNDGDYYNGEIDELRIYNRDLNSQEIKILYEMKK